MNSLANGLYYFFDWITKFAYLNFLWLMFSLFGLIVLGFIPATFAMFAVVRKWHMGEHDKAIFKTFWNAYRDNFYKTNLMGYILVVIGYILSIEFQILRASDNVVYFIASYGVLALFILYFITLIYFFPIFVHFNLSSHEYIKWPFIIGVIHPILTVFLTVAISIICYVILQSSVILLFLFGGSLVSFIIMWGSLKIFPKFELIKG